MTTDKQNLNRHILQMVEEIYKLIGPAVPEEWLSSELTVTQLRLLLMLHSFGPLRMSDIASKLLVSLPTATIIVNNLVRKDLVHREADPHDRRVVLCRLSPSGLALINKLWVSGQLALNKLTAGFTLEQLQMTSELVDLCYRNALKMAGANQ
jgi:DNA-binding MarR family transcriptional regulator